MIFMPRRQNAATGSSNENTLTRADDRATRMGLGSFGSRDKDADTDILFNGSAILQQKFKQNRRRVHSRIQDRNKICVVNSTISTD